MKKILLIVATCSIMFTMTSCVSNSEYEALKNENAELHNRLNEQATSEIVSDSVTEQTPTKASSSSELKQIKLGENVCISTPEGDFEIQIDNVHKTDIYDDDPNILAVTIQCVINNISFSGDLYNNMITGYEIAEEHGYIQLADSDGVAFPFYDISGPTDGAYSISHKVPTGSKSRESYPFLIPSGTKDVSVVINQEYILNTTIIE